MLINKALIDKCYNKSMDKNLKIIGIIFAFMGLLLLIWGANKSNIDKRKEIKILNEKIPSYVETTLARVNKAVISIPDEEILVGLLDGKGGFTSKINGKINNVDIIGNHIATKFIEGAYNKKDPRMDTIAPMYIDNDMFDGSMYVVLFQDRGDVALEKSYARIGGSNVVIDDIEILSPDQNIKDEEYRVLIKYKQGSNKKEVTLAVIDGHFDEKMR